MSLTRVSYCFTGRRAAAEELDYTPHAAARTLRVGESRLVLFINAGIAYGANLSVMIDTLSAEVAASGRSLVIWQQHDPDELAAVGRASLGVPGDLAIIGMDDEAVSAYTQPALTTIRLHVTEFARHLWTRASAALDGSPRPEHASSMPPFSLVQRDSA